MEQIIPFFKNNWVEISGFVTSVICVWYNVRQNIWAWFWSIVCVSIYAYFFFTTKFYIEVCLQIIYLVLSVYGWYAWLHGGKDKEELAVSDLPKKYWLPLVLLAVFCATSLGYFFQQRTNANLPYIDATTSVVSLIAQWMLAKKYLQNWLLWIFADIIYIGMFWYKDLYITSFLYVIFLGLATKGYLDWKKEEQKLSTSEL
jgi:nicotinamide mononucleotide transporter